MAAVLSPVGDHDAQPALVIHQLRVAEITAVAAPGQHIGLDDRVARVLFKAYAILAHGQTLLLNHLAQRVTVHARVDEPQLAIPLQRRAGKASQIVIGLIRRDGNAFPLPADQVRA